MQNKRVVLFSIGILLIVVIVYTWATWQYFTIPVPGGNDFLAHYSVWDLYIDEGVNPYSDEAALHTQELIRGRPARQGEDQNRLTYPFFSILVHGPFTFIDYALARAIYMTLLQAAIIVSVILLLYLLSWKMSVKMNGVLLAWSILHYPESRGIILGQFAPIGFLSIILGLYLLHRKKDLWAGAVMVISTMKPTLVFLLIPFFILWAISEKRWQFIFGLVGTLLVLVLGSLLLLPSWIVDWLERIFAYPEYTVGQSPIWLLCHEYFPALGKQGELILSVALVLALMIIWWRFFRGIKTVSFYWVIGITLLVSNVIVPRSATTNYVMLLLPIMGLFAATTRNFKGGWRLIITLMLISLIGHWWLHFSTVVGNQEQPILFLPIPIALGIWLIWGKRLMELDAQNVRSIG